MKILKKIMFYPLSFVQYILYLLGLIGQKLENMLIEWEDDIDEY